jgi:hypothetical protein
MKRRQFIAGLGSAVVSPVVARARQLVLPVIGFLGDQSSDDDFTVPFLQGLKETGYVEGQNVAVEYRYAENQMDRLQALALSALIGRRSPLHLVPTARARQRVSCKPELQRTASRHHAGDSRPPSGPRLVAPHRMHHRLAAHAVVDHKLSALRLPRGRRAAGGRLRQGL